MSWFFGKKKQQKDSPADSAEDLQTSDQGTDFVFVKEVPETVTPDEGHGTAVYPTSNLYPYVPAVPKYPTNTLPHDSFKDQNQGDSMYYLSGVPFKLCKYLESCKNNDIEIDRLRISEILSFIERIQDHNYDYNFSMEQSIVAEMNSRSHD